MIRGSMPDLFDTSAIPDDPAYWEERAERVAAVVARRSRRLGAGGVVHSRTSWLAASLLFAAALAAAVLPPRTSFASSFGAEWARALAPSDEIGKAIVLREGPPAIGVLILGAQRSE